MAVDHFRALCRNGFSYLRHASGDVVHRPDQLAIQVYTAVELFLKARLLKEHWSLVVVKDADLAKFEAGDFQSVPFDEAIKRLKNIVCDPVPDDIRESFDTLRRERNKIVHFIPASAIVGAGIDERRRAHETRVSAMKAWSDLHRLLMDTWSDSFSEFAAEVAEIDRIAARSESALNHRI